MENRVTHLQVYQRLAQELEVKIEDKNMLGRQLHIENVLYHILHHRQIFRTLPLEQRFSKFNVHTNPLEILLYYRF